MDESPITGESAPVIREAGGDRSAVTGGTKVQSEQNHRYNTGNEHPGLVALGARHMRLSKSVRRNPWDVSQRVAVIVCPRVGNVDDLRSGESFFAGYLRRVDRGWRFHNVDDLVRLLLMRKGYIHIPRQVNLHITVRARVVANLLHLKFVGSRREVAELTVACKIRFAAPCQGRCWRLQLSARGCYSHSVFVRHRNYELLPGDWALWGRMIRALGRRRL